MMMLWTYRVFHDKEGYCIRVVYYERDGMLISYQKEPAMPTGATAQELLQDIEAFKQAFELPILAMEELDTELATRPPQPKKDRSQNKTLDQVMTELDWESDRGFVAATPSEYKHSRCRFTLFQALQRISGASFENC
jgi:hypothetical protein